MEVGTGSVVVENGLILGVEDLLGVQVGTVRHQIKKYPRSLWKSSVQICATW